jgi:anti-repressor protein
MNELIKITTEQIGSANIETVDARELHKFLESKQDFSTWVKKRITGLGFVEGEDFIRLHKKMEANNATSIEYHLSLEMGKHLGMLEKNKKGKTVRDYFMDCEKKLEQQPALTLPKNYKEALQALIDKEVETESLQAQIEADKPKVEFATTFKASIGCISMGEFSKRLGIKDLGQNKLFEWMRSNGYLINEPRAKKNKHNLPFQRFIGAGYFEVETNDFKTKAGIRTTSTTMITTKGQIYFENKLRG